MSAIVPFDFSAPASRPQRRPNSINTQAMIGGGGFPVISIKGKVFAVMKDNERKIVTRVVDGEEEPAPFLNMVVVRANPKSRVFYAKSYVEGNDEGTKPTCFSHDGVHPDASVEEPQANNCATCPHAAWGTKMSPDGSGGKGTACTVNTRLAVIDPKAPETAYLLRVPAGSRANFNDAVKTVDQHGKDYNEVVFRIGFDQEAPSPKLTFRPTGILGDEVYAKVQALFDDEKVKDIVGNPTVPVAGEVRQPRALAAPSVPAQAQQFVQEAQQVARAALQQAAKPKAVSEDEIEAALATPAPVPAPAPARAKATKPASAKPVDETAAQLLGDLSNLLGSHDD